MISDSLFLAARGEGHEIKTRAAENTITRSVIASLNGEDSRLIDAPNGGVLTITESVLSGPNTANSDVIGFGLESGLGHHPVDEVVIRKNLILIDRDRDGRLLHLSGQVRRVDVSGNVIVSTNGTPYDHSNVVVRSQRSGFPIPALPLDRLHSKRRSSEMMACNRPTGRV